MNKGESEVDVEDGTQEPLLKKHCQGGATNVLSSESLANHAQSIIDEMDLKRKNDETLVVGNEYNFLLRSYVAKFVVTG